MTAEVFEDDPLLARLICEALSEICDSVHHSLTLADFHAHRKSLTDCPGLVWMDLRAPGNTIAQAFAETHAARVACPNSIIVVMSGLPMPEIREQALAAGADAVETKPFKTSVLDIARIVAIGALNAMERGASSSPRILTNMASMACKYFQSR